MHLEYIPEVVEAHSLPMEVCIVVTDDQALLEIINGAEIITYIAVRQAELVERFGEPDLVSRLTAEDKALLKGLDGLAHFARLVVDGAWFRV